MDWDVFNAAGRPLAYLTIQLGRVQDTTLDTGGIPIRQLRFIDWADTDAVRDGIVAPYAWQILATGRADNRRTVGVDESVDADMDVDITLTGGRGGWSVSVIRASGTASGRWEFAENVRTILVGETDADWSLDVGGLLSVLRSLEGLAGSIHVAQANTIPRPTAN